MLASRIIFRNYRSVYSQLFTNKQMQTKEVKKTPIKYSASTNNNYFQLYIFPVPR